MAGLGRTLEPGATLTASSASIPELATARDPLRTFLGAVLW